MTAVVYFLNRCVLTYKIHNDRRARNYQFWKLRYRRSFIFRNSTRIKHITTYKLEYLPKLVTAMRLLLDWSRFATRKIQTHGANALFLYHPVLWQADACHVLTMTYFSYMCSDWLNRSMTAAQALVEVYLRCGSRNCEILTCACYASLVS